MSEARTRVERMKMERTRAGRHLQLGIRDLREGGGEMYFRELG